MGEMWGILYPDPYYHLASDLLLAVLINFKSAEYFQAGSLKTYSSEYRRPW